MSKNLNIIAILTIFMLAGMTPFVMGAEPLKGDLSQKMIASNLSIPRSMSQSYAAPSPNTWYYGKVDDVWPWMVSDDTTFNLKSGNNLYTFAVKPASTVNGWNNAFMQNQIVNCIVAADTNNHYINVHTDENCQIDQVRLTATRV